MKSIQVAALASALVACSPEVVRYYSVPEIFIEERRPEPGIEIVVLGYLSRHDGNFLLREAAENNLDSPARFFILVINESHLVCLNENVIDGEDIQVQGHFDTEYQIIYVSEIYYFNNELDQSTRRVCDGEIERT